MKKFNQTFHRHHLAYPSFLLTTSSSFRLVQPSFLRSISVDAYRKLTVFLLSRSCWKGRHPATFKTFPRVPNSRHQVAKKNCSWASLTSPSSLKSNKRPMNLFRSVSAKCSSLSQKIFMKKRWKYATQRRKFTPKSSLWAHLWRSCLSQTTGHEEKTAKVKIWILKSVSPAVLQKIKSQNQKRR